jgi:hypothetical protein
MAIDYGHDIFTLASGDSIGLQTIFNSSDYNAGGGYYGPIVVAAADVNSPNQTLTPSTVGIQWKAPSSDLTTNCVYQYSIRNDGSFPASFTLHFFHN